MYQVRVYFPCIYMLHGMLMDCIRNFAPDHFMPYTINIHMGNSQSFNYHAAS